MHKSVLVVVLTICLGSLVALQAQEETKNEFFAGYSFHSADINTLTIDPHRTSQNGINLAYTRFVTKNFGVTVDLSAHFHRDTSAIAGGTFTSKRDQYFVLAGLQYKRHSDDRVQPFVHALFGPSLFRGFTSATTPAGNVFTIDDVTGFGMALGGGVDVRAGKRFDIRLVQADFTPTHFGSGWQNNFRLSVGIVFRH